MDPSNDDHRVRVIRTRWVYAQRRRYRFRTTVATCIASTIDPDVGPVFGFWQATGLTVSDRERAEGPYYATVDLIAAQPQPDTAK